MRTDPLRAAWKFLLSFRHRSWSLNDYPVRLRKQARTPGQEIGRLRVPVWHAQIINWWGLSGFGDTQAEALEDLRARFARWQSEGRDAPRPGRRVPITFAATYRVEEHPDIATDFFARVLDLDYAECFVSDESSLADFHTELSDEHLHERILLAYGVDVSDIEDGRLVRIFERLVASGASA